MRAAQYGYARIELEPEARTPAFRSPARREIPDFLKSSLNIGWSDLLVCRIRFVYSISQPISQSVYGYMQILVPPGNRNPRVLIIHLVSSTRPRISG